MSSFEQDFNNSKKSWKRTTQPHKKENSETMADNSSYQNIKSYLNQVKQDSSYDIINEN